MEQILALAKALSDPNRLRVLCALRGQERCACDIMAMLGLAQATVSRHLSLLVQAGLLVGRKEGRWTHYRLPKKRDNPDKAILDALRWVQTHGADTPQARADQDAIAPCCSKGKCA